MTPTSPPIFTVDAAAPALVFVVVVPDAIDVVDNVDETTPAPIVELDVTVSSVVVGAATELEPELELEAEGALAFSGAPADLTNRLSNTSSPLICWPAPVSPSKPPTHHLVPQLLFPSPAQLSAAASADASSSGVTLAAIDGASTLALASQRARKPLKANWSTSQVPTFSHAASNMTFVVFG